VRGARRRRAAIRSAANSSARRGSVGWWGMGCRDRVAHPSAWYAIVPSACCPLPEGDKCCANTDCYAEMPKNHARRVACWQRCVQRRRRRAQRGAAQKRRSGAEAAGAQRLRSLRLICWQCLRPAQPMPDAARCEVVLPQRFDICCPMLSLVLAPYDVLSCAPP